jgi:hypothetical protein
MSDCRDGVVCETLVMGFRSLCTHQYRIRGDRSRAGTGRRVGEAGGGAMHRRRVALPDDQAGQLQEEAKGACIRPRSPPSSYVVNVVCWRL